MIPWVAYTLWAHDMAHMRSIYVQCPQYFYVVHGPRDCRYYSSHDDVRLHEVIIGMVRY